MKTILRLFLINLVSLWATSKYIPGLSFQGGFKTLIVGAFVFMIINMLLVPLLKLLFLPLNILTLGLFSWIINVLAIYALTTIVTDFKIVPFRFEGIVSNGFSLPAMDLTSFWVAVLASLFIGAITNFLQWLSH